MCKKVITVIDTGGYISIFQYYAILSFAQQLRIPKARMGVSWRQVNNALKHGFRQLIMIRKQQSRRLNLDNKGTEPIFDLYVGAVF